MTEMNMNLFLTHFNLRKKRSQEDNFFPVENSYFKNEFLSHHQEVIDYVDFFSQWFQRFENDLTKTTFVTEFPTC